jgi:hypothetical protein
MSERKSFPHPATPAVPLAGGQKGFYGFDTGTIGFHRWECSAIDSGDPFTLQVKLHHAENLGGLGGCVADATSQQL